MGVTQSGIKHRDKKALKEKRRSPLRRENGTGRKKRRGKTEGRQMEKGRNKCGKYCAKRVIGFTNKER